MFVTSGRYLNETYLYILDSEAVLYLQNLETISNVYIERQKDGIDHWVNTTFLRSSCDST